MDYFYKLNIGIVALLTVLSVLVTSFYWPMNAKWVNSHNFSDKDQDLVLLQLEAEMFKFSSLLFSTYFIL